MTEADVAALAQAAAPPPLLLFSLGQRVGTMGFRALHPQRPSHRPIPGQATPIWCLDGNGQCTPYLCLSLETGPLGPRGLLWPGPPCPPACPQGRALLALTGGASPGAGQHPWLNTASCVPPEP